MTTALAYPLGTAVRIVSAVGDPDAQFAGAVHRTGPTVLELVPVGTLGTYDGPYENLEPYHCVLVEHDGRTLYVGLTAAQMEPADS